MGGNHGPPQVIACHLLVSSNSEQRVKTKENQRRSWCAHLMRSQNCIFCNDCDAYITNDTACHQWHIHHTYYCVVHGVLHGTCFRCTNRSRYKRFCQVVGAACRRRIWWVEQLVEGNRWQMRSHAPVGTYLGSITLHDGFLTRLGSYHSSRIDMRGAESHGQMGRSPRRVLWLMLRSAP